MKFISILFVTFFSLNSIAKESFEGVITYSITATSLTDKVSSSRVQEIYGNIMKIYYKTGFKKIEMASHEDAWEVYSSEKNKQYIRLPNSSEVEVADGSKEARVLASLNDEPSDLVILGKNTRLLTIKYKDGSISKYWYSPDIYIAPEQFKNLNFAYQNKYWEVAQSPYLKHVRISNVTKVVYVAEEIDEKKLDYSEFRVF